MRENQTQVIVVGAGHAGCEAALASARAGAETLLITINIDMVASMPCNPSIGGQGKGQLVREIDALGGEMGRAADDTRIQMRRLNTRKGIAVQANRFQSDKEEYSRRMLKALQLEKNVHLLQGLTTGIITDNSGKRVIGVETLGGDKWFASAVILTTGTFLRGRIHIGATNFPAGRAGEPPADELGRSLERAGLPIARFKTGTPPRVEAKSVCFDNLDIQEHDPLTPFFSIWSSTDDSISRLPLEKCYITRTNEATHKVIFDNIERSALIAGLIKGPGPRYCPSIEDKLHKFPDKPAHKVFLEPEGARSDEIYLQGLSTSLPESVQDDYVRTIPGLENAKITRPGYGIEYDIVDPLNLHSTLMSKSITGLFLAGQINGTSGYEEAAAQGILAGINAAATIRSDELLILQPEQSYLGLMIQEITTSGITEPYRVFTSRSPFRLQLRMSNAEERLSEIGHRYKVISEKNIKVIRERLKRFNELVETFNSTSLSPKQLLKEFPKYADPLPKSRVYLAQMLKRSDGELSDFEEFLPVLKELDRLETMEVEARIKYAGYLVQQKKEYDLIEKFRGYVLSDDFIDNIPDAVSFEARAKIQSVRPSTLGSLIALPGVRASDAMVLLMKLKKQNKIAKRNDNNQ